MAQDPIDAISGGYRASQVLLTANRLGVFAALGRNTMNADEIAKAVEADRRGTRILCDALVVLSLLEKEGENYKNSPLALEYLTPDAPNPRSALLWHGARLYERWGKLYDTVKTGKPAPEDTIDPQLRGDERKFALAMADIGRASARETAEILDLSAVKTLLDIGGGPGMYAIEFARHNPQLHAVVFDNEKTLEVTQANIRKAGLTDRVSVLPGDIFKDELTEEYDFIFISNLIHSYSYKENNDLISKCAHALTPGGQICIKDFLLNSDRTNPPWSTLFAVNMLVNTDRGDCYTMDEVKEWCQHANLTCDAVINVAAHSRILVARA
ncbi:MAG: methyltransferase [bacterium]